MSIFAYVGFPGSGKSYSVVEQQVLPALRQHRMVVTNLPLKLDLLKRDFPGCDIRPFEYTRALSDPNTILDDVPPGCVWVLDEVYKLFPAGMAVNKVPEAFKQILAEHRHRVNAAGDSMQVVLVCQDLMQISAFARQLVETTFRTTKLSALGWNKRFRVDMFNGPAPGANPPISNRLREIPGRYKPEVYQYYSSHTLSEAGAEGANEASMDTRANVFKRPLMIALPFVVVGLLGFGIYELWKRAEDFKQVKKVAKGEPVLLAPKAVPGAPKAAVAPAQGSPSSGTAVEHLALLGVAINLDHPEASVALLQEGNKQVVRPFEFCYKRPIEPLACELEGHWYTQLGEIEPPVALLVERYAGTAAYVGPHIELGASWAEQECADGKDGCGESSGERASKGAAAQRTGAHL